MDDSGKTIDLIEQYTIQTDKWLLLSIRMPVKLAKLGAVAFDKNSILIAGGIVSH